MHSNPKATCQECKRIFAKGDITVHLKTHTTRSCDLVCDFTGHLQAYKNHMKSHTNSELFNCQHCNIFCRHKPTLDGHIKKYHQIPFENDVKTFTYNDSNDEIICAGCGFVGPNLGYMLAMHYDVMTKPNYLMKLKEVRTHFKNLTTFIFKGVLTKHMTDLNASGPNYLL